MQECVSYFMREPIFASVETSWNQVYILPPFMHNVGQFALSVVTRTAEMFRPKHPNLRLKFEKILIFDTKKQQMTPKTHTTFKYARQALSSLLETLQEQNVPIPDFFKSLLWAAALYCQELYACTPMSEYQYTLFRVVSLLGWFTISNTKLAKHVYHHDMVEVMPAFLEHLQVPAYLLLEEAFEQSFNRDVTVKTRMRRSRAVNQYLQYEILNNQYKSLTKTQSYVPRLGEFGVLHRASIFVHFCVYKRAKWYDSNPNPKPLKP